jgi:hypothetical protein
VAVPFVATTIATVAVLTVAADAFVLQLIHGVCPVRLFFVAPSV